MKRVLPLLLVVGLTGACTRQEPPPAGDNAPAAQTTAVRNGDWPTYNGPLSGDRYSPLTQITAANVAQLRQACAFDTPDTVSFQTGIVAVNGVLYFTAFNNTYAVDAVTCQQKWKHSRPEPESRLRVNRGVGYSDGRLFRGTADAHVLAIDAMSGAQLWDVTIGDPKKGESVPMAPIAWNGLVFVGNAGGDIFGVTGRIYGLDAATGKVVWQFNTVPDSGPARATWPKASPENPPTGGATWTSYALDEPNGILYVSTGNPAPDFMIALRPGDNLYSNSVLALEAKTGRLIAYVQPLKGDFHDWDVSAGPALITTKSGRSVVAAAAKDGYVYLIDRAGVGNSANSANGANAANAANSANGANAANGAESAPSSTALVVRAKGLATTRENTETPLTSERFTRFCPGAQGGIEWNGPTHHRDLDLLYVNTIDWCASVKLQPIERMKGAPGMPWTGMDDEKMPFGRPDPIDRSKGWVTAIDADSGDVRWKVQTPKPMVAAITATAGGLVFTGDLDGNVLAYDAPTGKELWRNATGKAIGGGVISYEVGGKQYVAAAAGLNSPIWPVKGGPARVVVYTLP